MMKVYDNFRDTRVGILKAKYRFCRIIGNLQSQLVCINHSIIIFMNTHTSNIQMHYQNTPKLPSRFQVRFLKHAHALNANHKISGCLWKRVLTSRRLAQLQR